MTDPSLDCGYTDLEQALMDAEDANPGPNCVTPWEPDEQENGDVISPPDAQAVFAKISVALRGSGYLVGWFGSTAKGRDGNDIDVMIVQADRQAGDPIAALRRVADGEPTRLAPDPRVTFESWRLSVDGNRVDVHLHSGAAQDAWDRIKVLEKALREIMDLAEMPKGPYYPRAFSIAKAALAAGSASPEGAET